MRTQSTLPLDYDKMTGGNPLPTAVAGKISVDGTDVLTVTEAGDLTITGNLTEAPAQASLRFTPTWTGSANQWQVVLHGGKLWLALVATTVEPQNHADWFKIA